MKGAYAPLAKSPEPAFSKTLRGLYRATGRRSSPHTQLIRGLREGGQAESGNIGYYVILLTRQGRRSTGLSKTEPMHPATQIAGRSQVRSFEEVVHYDDANGEPLALAGRRGRRNVAGRNVETWCVIPMRGHEM